MLVRSPNGSCGVEACLAGRAVCLQHVDWTCVVTQTKLIKQEASATGRTGLPSSTIGDAISSGVVAIRLPCLSVLRALLRVLNSTFPASGHC